MAQKTIENNGTSYVRTQAGCQTTTKTHFWTETKRSPKKATNKNIFRAETRMNQQMCRSFWHLTGSKQTIPVLGFDCAKWIIKMCKNVSIHIWCILLGKNIVHCLLCSLKLATKEADQVFKCCWQNVETLNWKGSDFGSWDHKSRKVLGKVIRDIVQHRKKKT
jgi:hypothetical protein